MVTATLQLCSAIAELLWDAPKACVLRPDRGLNPPSHLVAEDLGRHVEVGASLAGQVGGGARLQPPRQPHVRHPRVPPRVCGNVLFSGMVSSGGLKQSAMRKAAFSGTAQHFTTAQILG